MQDDSSAGKRVSERRCGRAETADPPLDSDCGELGWSYMVGR